MLKKTHAPSVAGYKQRVSENRSVHSILFAEPLSLSVRFLTMSRLAFIAVLLVILALTQLSSAQWGYGGRSMYGGGFGRPYGGFGNYGGFGRPYGGYGGFGKSSFLLSSMCVRVVSRAVFRRGWEITSILCAVSAPTFMGSQPLRSCRPNYGPDRACGAILSHVVHL